MRSIFSAFATCAALAAAQTRPNLTAISDLFPVGPLLWDVASQSSQAPPPPYQVEVRADAHFPNRTIYVPTGFNGTVDLPVFAWSNGVCFKFGSMYLDFLKEIAGHGYLVVVPGLPDVLSDQEDMTDATWQITSLDLAASWKAPKGIRIVSRKTAIGGHSCGGSETIENLNKDEGRITTGLIMNSGATNEEFRWVQTPTLFVSGGSVDVLGANNTNNFDYVKKTHPRTPMVFASRETGHLGSYFYPRGGIYAELVVQWLDYTLKGKSTAKQYFVGDMQSAAAKRGWNITSNALDSSMQRRGRLPISPSKPFVV